MPRCARWQPTCKALPSRDSAPCWCIPTSLEFIIAMYACLYAGIIPIPTNPPGMNRSAQRLEAIATDARASLVLTTPEYQAIFLSEAAQFPDFARLTWVTRETIQGGGSHSLQIPAITPASTAFMQYTSGSTNIPKGVIISYRNFSHNMHAMHQTRTLGNEYSDDSVILTWTPLYHDMGLLIGVFLTAHGRHAEHFDAHHPVHEKSAPAG